MKGSAQFEQAVLQGVGRDLREDHVSLLPARQPMSMRHFVTLRRQDHDEVEQVRGE